MTWQDKVICCVGFSFSIMLLPQLYDCVAYSSNVNYISAFCTTTGLVAMSITFCTLKMWWSAASNILTAATWLTIAILSLS